MANFQAFWLCHKGRHVHRSCIWGCLWLLPKSNFQQRLATSGNMSEFKFLTVLYLINWEFLLFLNEVTALSEWGNQAFSHLLYVTLWHLNWTEYAFYWLVDWNSLIVGKISPWLDLDSSNEIVRKNSELVSCPIKGLVLLV